MQNSSALGFNSRPVALLKALALAALGVGLLTISAKMKVPFWPVPMTMQLLIVLAYGASLGERIAVGSVLAYLAVGAMGCPGGDGLRCGSEEEGEVGGIRRSRCRGG